MFSKSTAKYIQSLQHKKFRDQYNVFVAEGPKVVSALLTSKTFVAREIFALAEWVDQLDHGLRESYSEQIQLINENDLEKISAQSTANSVVAIFQKRNETTNINVKNKITLVLDDIQDPGNFGSIIRTADWFGIENIICSEATVEMYNSKVVQSTMASLGNVNIIYTDLVEWLGKQPVKIFAATLNGDSLYSMRSLQEAIVIIGNESKGIQPAVKALAQQQVTIPRIGEAESLNAAVATGIILSVFTGVKI